MLPNGLILLIDLALDASQRPALRRYEPALILGSLREDVAHVPVIDAVFEHLSFSHFHGQRPGGFLPFLWPGPRLKAERFWKRAHALRDQPAAAFAELGRLCHLLADMACPVHVHRVVHEEDPFEWYVEAHAGALRALPVPEVEPAAPADAIAKVAEHTRRFAPDRTHNAFGRVMRRLGRYQPVPRAELAEQAAATLPFAAAHAGALLRRFHDLHPERAQRVEGRR